VLITIRSSLARKKAINFGDVTRSQERFTDRKVSLGYSSFLGYEKVPDKDHPLVIVERTASIDRDLHDFIDRQDTVSPCQDPHQEANRLREGKANGVSAV
jgi:hypothetical protein